MTVTAFFDESGKHHDQRVVSLGGLCSFNLDFESFADGWGRLLHINGMRELSAKNVLRPSLPLGRKNDGTGLSQRIRDLVPFIECIRKNIQVVTGTAVDVRAFKKLPPHYFAFFGADPIYSCFLRSLLRVLEFTPDSEKVVL